MRRGGLGRLLQRQAGDVLVDGAVGGAAVWRQPQVHADLVLYPMGEIHEAEECFRIALKLQPNAPDYYEALRQMCA